MTAPAEKLNELAAAAQAATEARERAEKNLACLTSELDRERKAVAKAERDAAIEASISDPDVTIPNVDRSALEFAEKKAAAGQRAAESVREAEIAALQRSQVAASAFECAAGLAAMEKLQAELAKLKPLIDLVSLQNAPQVNEALFAAGFRISRSPHDRKVTLVCDGPAKVPPLAETCAAARGIPSRARALRRRGRARAGPDPARARAASPHDRATPRCRVRALGGTPR